MIADLLQVQVTEEIHCEYLTLTRTSHTGADQAYSSLVLPSCSHVLDVVQNNFSRV